MIESGTRLTFVVMLLFAAVICIKGHWGIGIAELLVVALLIGVVGFEMADVFRQIRAASAEEQELKQQLQQQRRQPPRQLCGHSMTVTAGCSFRNGM